VRATDPTESYILVYASCAQLFSLYWKVDAFVYRFSPW
jgi:hypothetical protein